MAVAGAPGNRSLQLPLVCYLVQTTDGKNILIDTGPGDAPPGILSDDDTNVIDQLETIGLRPDDIEVVICTHFDEDHVGRLGSFPNATLVVQGSHYEDALNNPRFESVRDQWDQPRERFQFVEGDTELVRGLELIDTSGHTLGHQSILVRLANTGVVVLAIDAVPHELMFFLDRPATLVDEDEMGVRASTKKLLDIAEREHATLVVFGHDPDQWNGLKRLPEYYD